MDSLKSDNKNLSEEIQIQQRTAPIGLSGRRQQQQQQQRQRRFFVASSILFWRLISQRTSSSAARCGERWQHSARVKSDDYWQRLRAQRTCRRHAVSWGRARVWEPIGRSQIIDRSRHSVGITKFVTERNAYRCSRQTMKRCFPMELQ